ncbi:MAG: DUF4169 family protein [Myxococcota bacterium]
MGEVINLANARKRKQREARKRQADANALAHGRTKNEKLRDRLERAHREAVLDGARVEENDGGNDDEPPAET